MAPSRFIAAALSSLALALFAAGAARADCITMNGSTSGSAQICSQATAGTATPFNLPNSNGSANNVLTTDGSGNTSWTGTPTLTGTNFTGIPAATALTGTVAKANGGTAATTGAAAAVNLSLPYVVCTPTLTNDTGTTSETKVATCQIPANTLGTGGLIVATYYGTVGAGNTNNKTHTVRWGPNNSTADTACTTTVNANGSTNVSVFMLTRLFATGATNTNRCVQATNNAISLTTTSDTSMNIDTTAITYLNITCTLGNTGDNCTAKNLRVIFYPGTGGN